MAVGAHAHRPTIELLIANYFKVRSTTLYRYINYKWVSINISYICHVKHHMTPTIDKEALLRIHTTKRGRKKKKSELTGDGRLPSPVLSYTEI